MRELFLIFLKLGFTSFGGPMAHIGFFEKEFVEKRKWLTSGEYAELIGLCNFLPGPASSQVGMAIGYRQAGVTGSLIAFLGFTLPSMIIMVILAMIMLSELPAWLVGALHGLKLLAVVVVADAVFNMAKKVSGRVKISLMLAVGALVLLLEGGLVHLGILVLAGMFGYLFLSDEIKEDSSSKPNVSQAKPSYWLWGVLVLGLVGLPALSLVFTELAWISSLFRVGSTVMGGGHVVLPMLHAETAVTDLVSPELFLAGYSFAQAVPGPMFTLASYLGVVAGNGVWGGIVGTLMIFMPGWLLLMLALPYWQRLKSSKVIGGAVIGIQVGVVGLLMATLYQFVWTGAVSDSSDVAIILLLWWIMIVMKKPVWYGIIAAIGVGLLLDFIA